MREVTVIVMPKAKEKMLAFAEAVTTEIGGLLSVERVGRILTVTDAWTVPQEVNAGGVWFGDFEFEDHMKAQGWMTGKPMPHICMGIWHSHGNLSVGMSTTDEDDLVRKYALRGYLVNLIVNRKGEWCCQVDTHVGPEDGTPDDFTLVTVPSKLTWGRDPEILALVEEQIAANVKERPAALMVTKGGKGNSIPLYGGHYGGHPYGFDDWTDDDKDDTDDDWWWKRRGPGRSKRKNGKGKGAIKSKESSLLLLDDQGVWTWDKKMDCLVKRNNHGALLESIKKGVRTIYDNGKPIVVTNDRTASTPYDHLIGKG